MLMDEACSSSQSPRFDQAMYNSFCKRFPMSMDDPFSSSSRPSALNKPKSFNDFGYPRPEQECRSPIAYNMVSKAASFSYSRFGNDVPAQEIGWDHGDLENKDERPYMIRWKSGKKVDQRLLTLLEYFFQDIYVKREDFFRKIFPGIYEEFADVLNKIGAMLWENNSETKYHTMQRSLSFGSPRRRPQRFNVRTPNVVIVKPDDQGGVSGQAANGSGNSK